MHTITITDMGKYFDCKIGCQHHFFTTEEGMIAEIEAYIKDPKGVEERWDQFRKAIQDPAMDRELIRRRRLAEAKDTEGMDIGLDINGDPEPDKGTTEDCCLTRAE